MTQKRHIVGDEVLLRIAQTLQYSFKSDDYLFRYGGEEFSVIINADDQENCREILEKARLAVESIAFSKIGKVTISIGAEKICPMTFYLSSVEKADKALYYCKDNGRNKLAFYSDVYSKDLQTTSENIDLF